jgi:hypothetical protein
VDGGLARWCIETLLALFKGQRHRRQPLTRQASRMLQAFEVHGVPPHQLPRFMPANLRLKPQEVTSPTVLANHIRTEHLDWASEVLALRRDWLDLESDQPHREVDFYRSPRGLYLWFEERQAIRGGRSGSVHVLTEGDFRDPGEAHGRFLVIYEEAFAEIDDKSLSRFWYLSSGSHFEHSPCVIDLLCILAIAEHFTLWTAGHVIPHTTTLSAEKGTLGLIPLALKSNKSWRPQDWVPVQYKAANCMSEPHRLYWEATRERLIGDRLEKVLTVDRYASASELP